MLGHCDATLNHVLTQGVRLRVRPDLDPVTIASLWLWATYQGWYSSEIYRELLEAASHIAERRPILRILSPAFKHQGVDWGWARRRLFRPATAEHQLDYVRVVPSVAVWPTAVAEQLK